MMNKIIRKSTLTTVSESIHPLKIKETDYNGLISAASSSKVKRFDIPIPFCLGLWRNIHYT